MSAPSAASLPSTWLFGALPTKAKQVFKAPVCGQGLFYAVYGIITEMMARFGNISYSIWQ